MSKSVSLKAYAKINLSLDILGKLEKSYHAIRSVFQSVSIFDMVSLALNNEQGFVNEYKPLLLL